MGLLGAIAGGVLQGTGQSMLADIAENRRIALENLRASNDARLSEARDTRLAAREDAKDDRKYEHDKWLLAAGAKFDVLKNTTRATNEANIVIPARTKSEVAQIGARAKGEQQTNASRIALQGQADLALEQYKTSAEADKDRREGTEVSGTEIGPDGNVIVVKKNGGVFQTKIKAVVPGAKGDELDATTARLAGVKPAGTAAPARAAAAVVTPQRGAEPSTPPAANLVSPADMTRYYTAASAKAANGDPRYKGLNATQIKAKVRDMLANQGYQLPD